MGSDAWAPYLGATSMGSDIEGFCAVLLDLGALRAPFKEGSWGI